MRARAEPFGAWVRIDDGTLVGVTQAAARRMGVDGADLWTDRVAAEERTRAAPPLEVHLAVTARCGVGCKGCYLDAKPDGDAPAFEVLEDRLARIAAAGTFTVAFGGGEPLSRPDLGRLAERARAFGLTPVVTTSGIGMTRARARSLAAFAQVNVSYDGEGLDYAAVRGVDGASSAERAMQCLREQGIPFGANVVLTRPTFARLEATVCRVEELGAREAQLLRYKPAGRAKDPTYLAMRLAPDQVDALYATLDRLVRAHRIAIRVDCAMLPLLSGGPVDPELLARFGVLGCEAGRHLAALRVDGRIAPCSFAPASDLDGGEAWDDGARGWRRDPTLEAWRALPGIEPCRSCPLRASCRGGCRVVAQHLSHAFEPDPECPRVRRARLARPGQLGEGSLREDSE